MAGETIITVVGNLTADPELRYTQNGLAVANFTIASTPRTFDRQLKLSEAVMRTKVLRAEEAIAQVATAAKLAEEKAARKAAAPARASSAKDADATAKAAAPAKASPAAKVAAASKPAQATEPAGA